MLSFFGQFMVETGLIDYLELERALDLMRETNSTIGELAISSGYMSRQDAEVINKQQRRRDKYFGELAVERGLLTEAQVEELLKRQKHEHIRIGAALARLGIVTEEAVEQAFGSFRSEQDEGRASEEPPPGWFYWERLAPIAVDFFPRLVFRVFREPVKIGQGRPWRPMPRFDHQGMIPLKGDNELSLALDISERQCRALVRGRHGWSKEPPTKEQLEGTIEELLTIMGQGLVERSESAFCPVEAAQPLSGELPGHGFCLPFVTPHGRGMLILSWNATA